MGSIGNAVAKATIFALSSTNVNAILNGCCESVGVISVFDHSTYREELHSWAIDQKLSEGLYAAALLNYGDYETYLYTFKVTHEVSIEDAYVPLSATTKSYLYLLGIDRILYTKETEFETDIIVEPVESIDVEGPCDC